MLKRRHRDPDMRLLGAVIRKDRHMKKPPVTASDLSGMVMAFALVMAMPLSLAGKDAKEVEIVNTPLPVTGNVGVSGAVAASQSGPWAVGLIGTPMVTISGTPSVTSASGDQTVLVGSYVGDPAGGGTFVSAVSGNVAPYKTIRVMTNCFAGGQCANINVRIYNTVGGRSYLIDQFPMQNFVVAGNVYEVLGTNLTVQLQNHNAGPVTDVGVAVFGRSN